MKFLLIKVAHIITLPDHKSSVENKESSRVKAKNYSNKKLKWSSSSMRRIKSTRKSRERNSDELKTKAVSSTHSTKSTL